MRYDRFTRIRYDMRPAGIYRKNIPCPIKKWDGKGSPPHLKNFYYALGASFTATITERVVSAASLKVSKMVT